MRYGRTPWDRDTKECAIPMKATATMDTDFLGADGGRLALAFASGCVAAFTFLSLLGGFFWKIMGKTRQDRIEQLEIDLKAEKAQCAEMEKRLVGRIEQLETILLFQVVGNVRQDAAIAIAELRNAVNQRMNDAADAADAAEGEPRPHPHRQF